MAELNLHEICEYIVRTAGTAGEIVNSARPSVNGAESKMNGTGSPCAEAVVLTPKLTRAAIDGGLAVDLVTETDKATEEKIISDLKRQYPDIEVLGEESYSASETKTSLSERPTFIIDPIDGTTNFVHSNPYVCISIGLTIRRQPVVGVIYNPFTGVLYTAIKDHGAYRWHMQRQQSAAPQSHPPPSPQSGQDQEQLRREEDKRRDGGGSGSSRGQSPAPALDTKRAADEIRTDVGTFQRQQRLPPRTPPAELESLSKCLVAVEWGSVRSGNDWTVKTRTFERLARGGGGSSSNEGKGGGAMVHSLRSLGSAALNLCAVASGELDVYWEAGVWAWDICAGAVILAEAGGLLVDANPGNWKIDLEGRRCLAVRSAGATPAGRRRQHDLVTEFWNFVEGRFEVGGRLNDDVSAQA